MSWQDVEIEPLKASKDCVVLLKQLRKMAVLGSMSRAVLEAAVVDTAFRDAIPKWEREDAAQRDVDTTRAFVINDEWHDDEVAYETFDKFIPDT